jgi:sec-independent protein translocase protein TatA
VVFFHGTLLCNCLKSHSHGCFSSTAEEIIYTSYELFLRDLRPYCSKRNRVLAVTGWEMIVVVGVLAVIFLWGPNKIPELARSIGQARREFEKAQKELTTLPSDDKPPAPTAPAPDDTLVSTAKKLGIATEGKTRDEISKEIVQKATENKTTGRAKS